MTPSGEQLIINHGFLPVVSANLTVTLKARGAWQMRLASALPPEGAWKDYDCEFEYSLPPSGGTHWIFAQVIDDAGNQAPTVSGAVNLRMAGVGVPLAVSVDNSVFYAVQQTLQGAGYVNDAGALTVGAYPQPIEDFIPLETEQSQFGGEVTSQLSINLPAVTVLNTDDNPSPGGLGGDCWERRSYEVSVYGASEPQSREIAAALNDGLRNGLTIYDNNFGSPGNPGFPQPYQVIGIFHVENLRDSRVLLPSYSAVDRNRRRLTFDVVNMRKS
jgi:hypothetical protein